MGLNIDNIGKRIDELIHKAEQNVKTLDSAQEIFSGLVLILELLYGKDNGKLKSLLDSKNDSNKLGYYYISELYERQIQLCLGVLRSIKTEIELGLIGSLEKQYKGEVFGDLIKMAKESMDNDFKDVAAVLGCAALEDSLKKIAVINGLDVEDKGMSEVINALKSIQILQGASASITTSYVKLRNKVFHAEFDKFEKEDVKSLIAFTEEFILKHLN